MIAKSSNRVQSKVLGVIYLVLAVPMVAFPLINDGNVFIAIAGAAFACFGLAALRTNRV